LEDERQRFVKEIQPLIQVFTITKIIRVYNCSPTYDSLIKGDKYVPHPAFYKYIDNLIAKIKE
jgi:hypothetical protein